MGLFDRFRKKNVFPFYDKPNTAAFTCVHVLEQGKPILHVSHDEDGYWQFLCGERHSGDEGRIVALAEAYELDPSVGTLAPMGCGHSADRTDVNGGWIIN